MQDKTIRPVVVFTVHKGVFFGYVVGKERIEETGDNMRIERVIE